mgnify:CR=1 FL=1
MPKKKSGKTYDEMTRREKLADKAADKKRWAEWKKKAEAREAREKANTVVIRKGGFGRSEERAEGKFYLTDRKTHKRIYPKGSEKAQSETIRKHGKDPDPREVRAAEWAGVDIRKKKRKPRKPRKPRQN